MGVIEKRGVLPYVIDCDPITSASMKTKRGDVFPHRPREKYLLKLEAITQTETNGTRRNILLDGVETGQLDSIFPVHDFICVR
jgi:hypothetical protein